MKVYQAINAVQLALSKEGISKSRDNKTQGYKFRGIDDVYNALSALLANNALCILPRMLSRSVIERESKNGGALFYVTVEAEFDFVSAVDASKHTVKTFGEAMDSGDKATNKAMSAAYKYACMQAFSIPTEGDNDADSTTHEVRAANDADVAWVAMINSCATMPDLKAVKADFDKSYGGLANVPALVKAAYNGKLHVLKS